MEKNSELETLKPSKNPKPFSFQRHRRRPIQSQTYRTFVQILSHCTSLQSLPQHQNQGKVAEQNESVDDDDPMEFPRLSVQEKSALEGTKEAVGSQDGGMRKQVHCLDPMDIVMEGNEKIVEEDIVNYANSVLENNTVNYANSVLENNIISDSVGDMIREACDGVSGPKEITPAREQNLDEQALLRYNEVPAAAGSSFEMETVAEYSRPVEHAGDKKPTVERNMPKGIEHELQLREKELEKLISPSGAMYSSVCLTVDDGIEEGEISGDIGVYDEAMNLSFDDADSLEEKKVEEVQVGNNGVDKEEFVHGGGESIPGTYDISSYLSVDTVDKTNGIMKLERQSTSTDPDVNSQISALGRDMEIQMAEVHDSVLQTGKIVGQASGVKVTDDPAASLKDLALHGEISTNTTEKSAEEDAAIGKNKRKKGPLSKERKAKKKKKNRIKRAEKNRKLGIKRLKLPPLKPKTVTYCRHYLRGRCQEGEKCKFSHDTVPLTKSKPCCHFARHSCMKGDDCPFDHQLSKYPCNNYATTGFCSRGADCLFSHEMPTKESPLITSNVSKPESKSPLLMNDPNYKKQMNIHCNNLLQSFDSNCSNLKNSSVKSAEKKSADHLQRPATQMPKGISVLSHMRSAPGVTGKHEQLALPLENDDGVKVGHDMTSNLSGIVQKSNEIAKTVPMRTPKGINFLSFGKAPLADSRSYKNHGINESLLCELNKRKLFGSPSINDSNIEIKNRSSQSSVEVLSDKNKIANIISPASTLQGMKFLSFSKVPADSNAVRQAGLIIHNVNSALPFTEGRENALDGNKFSKEMAQGLTSSSNPFRQSLGQSILGSSGGMLNSLKTSILSNTPSSLQKALNSTLAFAAKFDSQIKLDPSIGTPAVSTEINQDCSKIRI